MFVLLEINVEVSSICPCQICTITSTNIFQTYQMYSLNLLFTIEDIKGSSSIFQDEACKCISYIDTFPKTLNGNEFCLFKVKAAQANDQSKHYFKLYNYIHVTSSWHQTLHSTYSCIYLDSTFFVTCKNVPDDATKWIRANTNIHIAVHYIFNGAFN